MSRQFSSGIEEETEHCSTTYRSPVLDRFFGIPHHRVFSSLLPCHFPSLVLFSPCLLNRSPSPVRPTSTACLPPPSTLVQFFPSVYTRVVSQKYRGRKGRVGRGGEGRGHLLMLPVANSPGPGESKKQTSGGPLNTSSDDPLRPRP